MTGVGTQITTTSAVGDRLVVRGEVQAAGVDGVAKSAVVHAGDDQATLRQRRHSGGVHVDARDGAALDGRRGGERQADVPLPDDADLAAARRSTVAGVQQSCYSWSTISSSRTCWPLPGRVRP